MPWYAAHAILFVQYTAGPQEHYPIWENIYLIAATDADNALALAEQRAQEDTGDSAGSFTWNARPAIWQFAGIRALIAVSHPTMQNQPVHGAEITYLAYEVATQADLQALVQGDSVHVQLGSIRHAMQQGAREPSQRRKPFAFTDRVSVRTSHRFQSIIRYTNL